MDRSRTGIVGAVLVCLMATPSAAVYAKVQGVQYEWDDAGKCVTKIDIVKNRQGKKELEIKGRGGKVKWHFFPYDKKATRGEWRVRMDDQQSDLSLCKDKYRSDHDKDIECSVKEDLKYYYFLEWYHSDCNNGQPVKADPVVIFKDGGSGFTAFLPLISGVLFLFSAGLVYRLWLVSRRAAP